MSQTSRKPSIDPYRKARFRGEARGIVFKDRYDRKYGRAVDTAGAIGGTFEHAYRQGFAEAQEGLVPKPSVRAPAGEPLDWALIPPRPRSAFWSCCLFTFGRRGDKLRVGCLEPAVTERGTQGWRVVMDYLNAKQVIGAQSIAPLVRLGLLEPNPAAPGHLKVSARGRATISSGRRTVSEDDVPSLIVTTDPDTAH